MGIHVENDSFHEDYPLIITIKRSQIMQGGGTPSDQSGGHLSPGGECFAPWTTPNKHANLFFSACNHSTAKMLLDHHFGVRKRHVGAKFHDFLESLKIILDTMGITPNGLWWSPVMPGMLPCWFWCDSKSKLKSALPVLYKLILRSRPSQ